MSNQHKLLVIKLSAFGDFMISMGCFKSIRYYYPNSKITLLTTKSFEKLAKQSRYFDEILIDDKPRKYNPFGLKALRAKLRSKPFDLIFDLQLNNRSTFYHRLMWDVPFIKKGKTQGKWAGIDKKAEFYTPDLRYVVPPVHAIERNEAVLIASGIDAKKIVKPDLSWMKGDLSPFNLPDKFAMIMSGCAPTNPEKRWPKDYFVALCRYLCDQEVLPVLVGGAAEEEINRFIEQQEPRVLNLTSKTKFDDLAELGRKATIAIGNDTGPTHVASMAGAPTMAFFCLKASNPIQSGPVGKKVHILQADDLSTIMPEDAIQALDHFDL